MTAMRRYSGPAIGLVGLLAVTAAAIWAPSQAEPGQATGEAVADTSGVRPGDPGHYGGWGAAKFSHFKHFEELEIACVDCHHETNAGSLVTPHASYFEGLRVDCALCHERGGTERLAPLACVECHPKVADGAHDQNMSTKVVVHRTCWTCHDEGTGPGASANCLFCHEPPTGGN